MRIRIFLLPVLFIVLCAYGMPSNNDTMVYVCMGKGSKKYHYRKDCRGLSNCSTKIYEVTLTKAKDLGRTLCGWED